jgi:hypothetical protein
MRQICSEEKILQLYMSQSSLMRCGTKISQLYHVSQIVVTPSEEHAAALNNHQDGAANLANHRINLPPFWTESADARKKGLPFSRQDVFPARESLVGDIPAGDGKIVNLFLQCGWFAHEEPRFLAKKHLRRVVPFRLRKNIIQLCCSTPSRTLTRTSRTPRLKEDLLPAAHAHQVSQGDGCLLSREMAG